MKDLVREPLVHFLVIGAVLFLLFQRFGASEPVPTETQIVVPEGRILQLANVFQKTWQRPPTRDELQALIDDFVLEEAYYRQAIAMGIDRDDTIIRRRLRQKLEFLAEDASALAKSSDEDLANYLAEHADKFRQSPQFTLRQLYFNPEDHGADPEGYVATQLARLNSGLEVPGDTSLLPQVFSKSNTRELDGIFGNGFAQQLAELPLDEWQGPIRSGLGLHLVQIEERVPGRLPSLDEIRPQVDREWQNDRRIESRRLANERLLAPYEVVVQWPDEEVGASEGEP